MTLRSIDDGFWDWDDVQSLSANAKYLYIYSWTNKHSNLAACYHITLKTICFETALSVKQVENSLKELAGKVVFDGVRNWLWVRNFIRRQPGSSSESFLRRINKILSETPADIALSVWELNSTLTNWLTFIEKPTASNRWVPEGYPTDTHPSITVTGSSTDTEEDGGVGEGETIAAQTAFDRFWAAYPKKRAKGDAEKAWNVLKPSEPLVTQIIATVELAKTSAEWQKDDGQYIPYPATWLRRRGWEDEYDRKETHSRAGTSTEFDTEFAGIYE